MINRWKAAIGWAILLAAASVSAVTRPDGLEVETIDKPATCDETAMAGDTIGVNYRGSLVSGKLFDSNENERSPFTFKLGAGYVISGWDLGVEGMCIGETRRLVIPPAMAYGNRQVGPIPPGSTLVFEVRLIKVQPGPNRPKIAPPPPKVPPPPPAGTDGSEATPPKPEQPVLVIESECKLLGKYSLAFQVLLAVVVIGILVIGRYKEKPQRPRQVFIYDVLKQVIGSSMMHFSNLALSMLSSGQFTLSAGAARLAGRSDDFVQFANEAGQVPNPCAVYMLNLGIDATIGVLILKFWLWIFHAAALYTPLGRPAESIVSGQYSPPGTKSSPRFNWWLRQCIIYFFGLFAMKFCVFLMLYSFPSIIEFGEWVLSVFDGEHESLEAFFVMLLFPLVMNAFQWKVIDSFIKKQKPTETAVAEEEPSAPADNQDSERVGLLNASPTISTPTRRASSTSVRPDE